MTKLDRENPSRTSDDYQDFQKLHIADAAIKFKQAMEDPIFAEKNGGVHCLKEALFSLIDSYQVENSNLKSGVVSYANLFYVLSGVFFAYSVRSYFTDSFGLIVPYLAAALGFYLYAARSSKDRSSVEGVNND